MVTFLISSLSLVAIPMMVEAMRVSNEVELDAGIDMQAIINMSQNVSAAAPVPKFSFSIKKTLCANLNFGNMKGIVEKHPKAVKKMRAQGAVWANEYNCRLCDLEGDEFTLTSLIFPDIVKCNAFTGDMNGNLESACLAGNGKPGWRHGDNMCVPCPQECEKCEKPGKGDATKMAHAWFKCILPEVDQTPVPEPWKCESVKERRKHQGQFQWCKYRKNLVNTSTNGNDPEPSSTWQLKVTGTRCDKTEYDADEHVSEMVKLIAPKLTKASTENCELCRVTMGGPLTPDPAKVFVLGESSSEAWVDTKCAWDELGSNACKTGHNSKHWNKKGCNPCPPECASCVDASGMFDKKMFKCNLRFSEGAGDEIAGLMFGNDSKEEYIPKPPEGYECDTPVKKNCLKGKNCVMGYKTHCKYPY